MEEVRIIKKWKSGVIVEDRNVCLGDKVDERLMWKSG